MLLAIDIGNTNINFGVFKGKKIIKRFFVPTKSYTPWHLKSKLKDCAINDAILCSVVSAVTPTLVKDLKKILKKAPIIIGKEIKVPLKNLYRKPRQVGQDRLVNAYAGVIFHKAPLVVIDFGTAITFDVISKNKEYLGGMILPGLHISLDALSERTALLPKVKLARPKELIGRDTESSILSGIVYGVAALVDDLSSRIKQKIGKDARVVGTGGNAELIARYAKEIDKIDSDLTLKGLSLIYGDVSIFQSRRKEKK